MQTHAPHIVTRTVTIIHTPKNQPVLNPLKGGNPIGIVGRKRVTLTARLMRARSTPSLSST